MLHLSLRETKSKVVDQKEETMHQIKAHTSTRFNPTKKDKLRFKRDVDCCLTEKTPGLEPGALFCWQTPIKAGAQFYNKREGDSDYNRSLLDWCMNII